MKSYLDLAREVLEHGEHCHDRTGTGTLAVAGMHLRLDLQRGFPLLTTKSVFFPNVIGELCWMMRGSGNADELREEGNGIWDQWRQPWRPDGARETVSVRARHNAPVPQAWPRTETEVAAQLDGQDWGQRAAPRKGQDASRVVWRETDRPALIRVWLDAMGRCADPGHPDYARYGAQGFTVDARWHDPATFMRDAAHLPQAWQRREYPEQFYLDGGAYGAAQYGPDTAIWNHVSQSERTHRLEAGQPLERLRPLIKGDLGPVYGVQWRRHVGLRRSQIQPDGRAPVIYTDQLQCALDELRRNPASRRSVVDAWNPSELDDMALPPCHRSFQLDTTGGRLNIIVTQRSADVFLGLPYNLAFYAAMAHVFAQQLELPVGIMSWHGGNVHIYDNHREQIVEQLSREPRPLPRLRLAPVKSLNDYRPEHFILEDYHPHGVIRAPVSV